MPVVKMGSGAQTQAKHCQGRGEGDRFGCQVQFTFLSAFVSEEGKEKVKPVAPVYLHLFFVFLAFLMVLCTRSHLRTRGKHILWATSNHCRKIFKFSHHITKWFNMFQQQSYKVGCISKVCKNLKFSFSYNWFSLRYQQQCDNNGTMWNGVMNPQSWIWITWICILPQLYRNEEWISTHCLAVRSSALCFWLTLALLIRSFSAVSGSCFKRKSSKNPLYTASSAPNSRKKLSETKWWP